MSLRGVFLSMKYEIPALLRRGGGAIVNTSSGAGIKGFAGGAAYGAARRERGDRRRSPRPVVRGLPDQL
jgi:NAD(P)-dependent dehydrogenase (short-subunit alcohol dehydrogenase family)